jgi:hypothetical protein
MQLSPLLVAFAVSLGLAGAAHAQSLAPMHNTGTTPSLIKGFRLYVGNPYKTRMIFLVEPMDPKFKVVAPDAAVNQPEIALAPGATRPVIVTFKIDPQLKERTIGVCVLPKDLEGPVLPRVCGTYTGKLIGAGG